MDKRTRGVAVVESFGTYVAQIAEVSVDSGGSPRVHKVWCAVDCGVAVNPDVIRAQMEGGIGFGLGHVLFAEISIDAGRTVQSNFDTYQPIRMNEAPKVEGYFVPSTEPPSGVGEPPIPPLAPALCNAIYAATKKRIRALPIMN